MRARRLLAAAALLGPGAVLACGSCRPLVLARVAAELDGPVLLGLAAPVLLPALVAAALLIKRRKT